MKQTVLIGLGGTGSRVVNNVVKDLQQRNIPINDGIVTCVVMDTNKQDNNLIQKSGTSVPVIPTADDRSIEGYVALHMDKEPSRWCPYSPTFYGETMLDGASEMRVKSRIAFMDTMEDNQKIGDLISAIEKVFQNRPGVPEKVRVMVVSSLAGGTGSGMFIQVALWLRQFFEERSCAATIRGILLLPDIFVKNVSNISQNPRKILYHYANAYAAIRELNAINKVVKGNVQLESPLILDDLFDSRTPGAKPVFDNAFFIDNVDAKGASFNSVGAYERMAAQIVYMQLYAPMYNELYSVEDNLYRAFDACPDPVYGSCGTAKAVYPVDDVVEYCALSAARDSIQDGWSRIDREIDSLIEEQKKAEKDGMVVTKPISRRDKYVSLFDQNSTKSGAEVGRSDRLFVSIRKDVFNEHREIMGEENEVVVQLTSKVDDFLDSLDEAVRISVTKNGGGDDIRAIGLPLKAKDSPASYNSKLVEELKGIRAKEKTRITRALTLFEENCNDYADEIIRSFVPSDMGAVNSQNANSLYGFFVKKNPDGQDFFVHPVAARYLLYKLQQRIEQVQDTLSPDSKKTAAERGGNISFDNPKTRKHETLDQYWNQIGISASAGEIHHFISKYMEFNQKNAALCEQYEADLLKQKVLKELNEYVSKLVTQMENVFKKFDLLVVKLNEDLEKNIARNENNMEKVMYVFASEKNKDAVYTSLNLDLSGRNSALNKEIINAVYGKFCAEVRPNATENEPYGKKSIIRKFRSALINSFAELVEKEHQDEVQLDIYSAIKAEADFNQPVVKNTDEDEENLFDEELETQRSEVRYNQAFNHYRDNLLHKAAPFLKAVPDSKLAVSPAKNGLTLDHENKVWMRTESGKLLYMPFNTRLTFWGYHPSLVKNFPDVDAALGTNSTTAADAGYGVNELYCYSSIYGVRAEAVDKFNEVKGGEYYENYSAVIRSQIEKGLETETPHLDKTWHEFLPYVSSEKQKMATASFYRAFWLAVAYGRVCLDNQGFYEIVLETKDSYGNTDYTHQLLKEDDRTIGATEITRLIRALRIHPEFESIIIPQLEARFNQDVTGMTTYVGTDVIAGLIREGDLNPVTMVVRYENSQGYNPIIKSDLIGGISQVMHDVAARYDLNRGEEKIREAQIRLCHRIYEKSTMVRKNILFESWLQQFKQLKLPVSGAAEETAGAANHSVEDII